ncbi:MAG TPA: hypothetical protein VK066_17940 [Chloroflexota bacterium]|nr:hypothetical protein [Chloroflexota bacterium]
MDELSQAAQPKTIAKATLAITRGVAAGWAAGIPQVVVTQIEGHLLGKRERADIGPRFVARAAQHEGRPLPEPVQWLLAGVFHFEYAALWGALYALAVEPVGARRVPPWLGGSLLGAVIYTAAFSPVGGATRTGAERPLERRRPYEMLLHCSAALSFGLTNALAYRWLREHW